MRSSGSRFRPVGSGRALLLLSAIPLHAAHPCDPCHADIARKYARTPMALTSGPVASAAPGSFTANGHRYSVRKQILTFDHQSRQLAFYVGSGGAARSYLLNVDNFLYESPATYYTRMHAWALSPGYERYPEPFLTRAIAPACLQCHATEVRPIEGTQNGYQSPPFSERGIGCERCHPPDGKHYLNPARLDPARRDSVCAQCHLSGEIRVDRAGRSMADFRPGDLLSDYAIAFVRVTDAPGMKVTSHVESLAQSACARKSKGRLWCGTCHDPHTVPSEAEKVAYYRAKCITCHAPAVCARGDNCTGCHMPSTAVTDADHVVYTDHSIARHPVPRNRKPPADATLAAFGAVAETSRDLGVAYAVVALRERNGVYSQRAFDLLSRNQDDPQALAYLADIYRARQNDRTAERLYQKLYALDRTQSSAPANLG
ncbi:MAG: hypothetical protein KGN84_05445, partial [Acidobacteriota bacterium]|nr:hypothetical protein [Acidobacteriota bacterium]